MAGPDGLPPRRLVYAAVDRPIRQPVGVRPKDSVPSSADRLHPEYQHVAVGDIVCDGPNYASYFRVQHVDPPHALVYRSIRHPRHGSPIDINDPESPSKIEKQLLTSGTYVDFTWALVLYDCHKTGHDC
jgi:hypothetical protein